VVQRGYAAAVVLAVFYIGGDGPRARGLAAAAHRRAHDAFGFAPFLTRLEAMYEDVIASGAAR
jgi:hypothetical protein